MKLITTFFAALFLLAQNPAYAQTSAKPATHSATHTGATRAGHAETHACSRLPELSPKIPALPAGSPCARPLYTLTTVPAIRVDYSSPQEGDLRETLGIEPATFSLDYVDTRIGTGELAAPHKYYSIRYTGYLTDGTKFDASADHGSDPYVFPVGQHQVIAGWDTGFAGMRVGGKRRLFIPFQLAYGPSGHNGIPPKAELIFDLEFIAQSEQKPEPKAPAAHEAPYQPAPKPTPATPPSTATPAQPAPAPKPQ